MAVKQKRDYLDELLHQRRVEIRPYDTKTKVVTSTIDFEKLFNRLKHILTPIFQSHRHVSQGYYNMFYDEDDDIDEDDRKTIHDIRKLIAEDLNDMLSFALMSLYNRLRVVALNYSLAVLDNENHGCNGMEFPTYLSSLMQGIGPLRFTDPANLTIIYLPLQGTMKNIGRENYPNPCYLRYKRLIGVINAAKIPTCHISTYDYFSTKSGSFWTTCRLQTDGDLTNVVGTVNPCYYENEDVVRALLLSPDPKQNSFPEEETTRRFSPTCYIARNLTDHDVKTLLKQKFLPLMTN